MREAGVGLLEVARRLVGRGAARACGARAVRAEGAQVGEEVREEGFQRGQVGGGDADVHFDSANKKRLVLAGCVLGFGGHGGEGRERRDVLLPDVIPRAAPREVGLFEKVVLHGDFIDGGG